MKEKMKIIAAAVLLLCFTLCRAQRIYQTPSQEREYHKNGIASTSYIFEGKVIQQQCYYSKRGEILTDNIIQINNIYKGAPQIKLGTIKVITLGGSMGNIVTQISDEGATGIAKGHVYIIFAKSAYPDIIVDNMVATDNTIVLTRMDCVAPIIFPEKKYRNGHLIPLDYPAATWDRTTYKTLDDLNDFLKENGLTIQEQVPQADSTKN